MQATKISTPRLLNCLAIVAGGLLFVAFFYVRYQFMPSWLYETRDDGVITLSHARNLIDYGFIGVNPSGERVEGYSAPSQFFIYATLYALTGLSFETYIQLQTLVCTFLLGAMFMAFFEGKYLYRLAATALGALILCTHAAFLEWHGSGLENAITHVLFLATILVMYSSIRSGRINLWLAPIPLLASVSRLESIYHIAPLLVIFCMVWLKNYRTPKALYFTGIVICGWCAFMAWRYWYFGSLYPNTAVAQEIDIIRRINRWQYSLQETLNLSKAIFPRQGIYILPFLAPMVLFLPRTLNKAMVFFIFIVLCTLITGWFQPFFFGRARLDIARTTTHLALYIALLASMLVFQAQKLKPLLIALPLLALAAWGEIRSNAIVPYYIGYGTQEFQDTLKGFTRVSMQEHIPRPTVANADLGMISWVKRFNVIDLGKLGSPLLTAMSSNRDSNRKIPDYFFEFATPDIIESHSAWSCNYYNVLHDPRFRILYQPVWERSDPYQCGRNERLSGIWVRKDMLAQSDSAERHLVDSLTQELSTQRIATELTQCESAGSGNCAYVVRSAYRFLPEFRQQGTTQELLAIFDRSPIPQFSRYLITGAEDANAYKDAITDIMNYRPPPAPTP